MTPRMQIGLALALVLTGPAVAAAQDAPTLFVSGGVAAVFNQEADARVLEPPAARRSLSDRSGTTAAATFTAGVFLAPRWNVRFELSLAGTVDVSTSTSTEVITQTTLGERQRHTGSVLVGYLAPPRGRVQVGYFAGLAFIRERQRLRLNTELITPLPLPPPDTFFATETEVTALRQGPQVGIEAVIDLAPKIAVVPAFSAIAFSGTWLLQPGVSVRVRF